MGLLLLFFLLLISAASAGKPASLLFPSESYHLSSPEPPSPVLEDGYSIVTVLDGNKLQEPIHPYSIQRQGPRSAILVLDSTASSFFSLQLPVSQDGQIQRFAGNGASGYSDGKKDASSFAHPRSFAVDGKGNVYVADRSSHVIRKIDAQGTTTTVAGGYSRKAGKTDGPAQNASFSDDFELIYVPEVCALLISDRGNSLVRQMNLKQEDCIQKSPNGLGGTSVSLIAILCALVGFVIGMLVRPFLSSRAGNTHLQARHDMEALPVSSGTEVTDSLLRHQKRNC